MAHVVNTLRELARHALFRTGLRPSRYGFVEGGRAARFTAIYDQGMWQLGEGERPLSGPGSSLAATASLRDQLPGLLGTLGSGTLLDVGCGDLTWLRTLNLERYIGVDIVPSVIADNQKVMPQHEFHCLDAVVDDLPDADTVLCREVLFHLSFADIKALIANLQKKDRKWLIATTDTASEFNADIDSGDFRLLNLRRHPFRFGEPHAEISDDGHVPGRKLLVWPLGSLNLA